MDKNEFIRWVEETLQSKTLERDALVAQRAGVERKLNAVTTDIERLQTVLHTWREYGGPAEEQPSVGFFDGSAETEPIIPMGTIAQMAAQIMQRAGGRMKVAALVAELRRAGKLGGRSTTGDYGTVFRTLDRNPRFKKLGPGEFELVDQTTAVSSLKPSSRTSA